MIESYLLEALIAFADEGTLSAASESLLISQPALSRSMKKLEEELGVKLFTRTKNSITLNENGEYYLKYARQIKELNNQAMKDVREYDRKNHIIHVGMSIPGPQFLYRNTLQQRFPDKEIIFEMNENTEQLIQKCQRDYYDLLFLHTSYTKPGFVSKYIFEERLGIAVLAANPIASFDEISFSDVDGFTILQDTNVGYWNSVVRQYLSKCHIIYQTNRNDLDMLIQNSTIPTFITNLTDLSNSSIPSRVNVYFKDEQAYLPIYIVCKKERLRDFGVLLENTDF